MKLWGGWVVLGAVAAVGGALAAPPRAGKEVAKDPGREVEAEVVSRINAIRKERRLGTLQANEKLADVAREYSRRMAEKAFFSHTGPQGDTTVDRVRRAGIGYRVLGENLFSSTNLPRPAQVACDGWMKSPGHRHNILLPDFTETGVGAWHIGRKWWITQLFRRP